MGPAREGTAPSPFLGLCFLSIKQGFRCPAQRPFHPSVPCSARVLHLMSSEHSIASPPSPLGHRGASPSLLPTADISPLPSGDHTDRCPQAPQPPPTSPTLLRTHKVSQKIDDPETSIKLPFLCPQAWWLPRAAVYTARSFTPTVHGGPVLS